MRGHALDTYGGWCTCECGFARPAGDDRYARIVHQTHLLGLSPLNVAVTAARYNQNDPDQMEMTR